LIQDERDYRHHVDYVHRNPLKHGLVERVVDWPYSSEVAWKKCVEKASPFSTLRNVDASAV